MVTFELMGLMVFVVGMFLIVISVLSTLTQIGTVGELERFVLFIAGAATCAIGYYMATRTSD